MSHTIAIRRCEGTEGRIECENEPDNGLLKQGLYIVIITKTTLLCSDLWVAITSKG